MNHNTLSSKLFIRIAPTIILAILLIGLLAFFSADKEIETVYDAQLISNANVLWTLVSDELKEEESSFPKRIADIDLTMGNQNSLNDSADDYAEARMFRVWESDKKMMYSDTAFPDSIPKQPIGFSTLTFQGDEWRIYTLPIPNKAITIEVGEKIVLRDALVVNILLDIAVPLLLLIPAVGLMIWFSIGKGLGTIHSLVEQIRKRSPDDLSPVNMEAMPKDLAPLGKSLNNLFTKLEHSFSAEKRFTDHAAHQLRTPQATIKLQLQMLVQATSAKEKEALIGELMLSNERATKLITMLLTSARIHHQPIHLQLVAVYPAIAAIMAEMGVIANQKHIIMSLHGDEGATVLADEVLLKLMMSNLIENAIKYTPDGGSVTVIIQPQDSMCLLSVSDTGCGIPEDERDLVFGRFYRVATPEVEGSGLGLSIVSEVIKRFNGSITLNTPANGSGLLVEVLLPSK